MPVTKFEDDENGYLAWLSAHPDGFVLNTRRPPDPHYLILHRARCGTISSRKRTNYTTAGYMKICADLLPDVESWSSKVGQLDRCGVCWRDPIERKQTTSSLDLPSREAFGAIRLKDLIAREGRQEREE